MVNPEIDLFSLPAAAAPLRYVFLVLSKKAPKSGKTSS